MISPIADCCMLTVKSDDADFNFVLSCRVLSVLGRGSKTKTSETKHERSQWSTCRGSHLHLQCDETADGSSKSSY